MSLPYTVIKTEKQYYKYCDEVEQLFVLKNKTKDQKDTLDLLIVLIENYDEENNKFEDVDPITLLKYMMQNHKMKPVDLARLLGISKSLMSDLLNYRRAISKVMVRKLAERFGLQQEAFNRPYWLKTTPKPKPKRKKKKSLKPA